MHRIKPKAIELHVVFPNHLDLLRRRRDAEDQREEKDVFHGLAPALRATLARDAFLARHRRFRCLRQHSR